jgi:hypothetical protein
MINGCMNMLCVESCSALNISLVGRVVAELAGPVGLHGRACVYVCDGGRL